MLNHGVSAAIFAHCEFVASHSHPGVCIQVCPFFGVKPLLRADL